MAFACARLFTGAPLEDLSVPCLNFDMISEAGMTRTRARSQRDGRTNQSRRPCQCTRARDR